MELWLFNNKDVCFYFWFGGVWQSDIDIEGVDCGIVLASADPNILVAADQWLGPAEYVWRLLRGIANGP